MVSAILFDLDGTLFNHEASVRAALHEWIPPFADSVDEADLVPGFRRESDEFERLAAIWLELEEHQLPSDEPRLRLREFLRRAGMPSLDAHLDQVLASYQACYETNLKPYQDAVKCLKAISKRGIPAAVLTNGEQSQQGRKTVAAGLAPWCGPVFASSGIGAAKPEEGSYLLVCQRLGVDPTETVMVGDNYVLDVLGAREAGLRAVHVDRSGTHRIPDPTRIMTLAELAVSDPDLGTVTA